MPDSGTSGRNGAALLGVSGARFAITGLGGFAVTAGTFKNPNSRSGGGCSGHPEVLGAGGGCCAVATRPGA